MPPRQPTRPYPITAYAAASGLGNTAADAWTKLSRGERGLVPCPLDVPFRTVCGVVTAELPPMPSDRAQQESRLVRLALLAYRDMADTVSRARERWGPNRVAVVLSTSTGGIGETEDAYAYYLAHGCPPPNYDFSEQHAFDVVAQVVGDKADVRGPRYVLSTACSSSAKAFGTARRLLDANVADAVLLGGIDALCLTTVRGFHSLGVLAETPSRPFGAGRPGMNLGEAAALCLLEREGAPRAWLRGVGETSDAFHMSAPDPEGRGARASMEAALRDAGLVPSDIDHINAHGTGTERNDVIEAAAIEAVFGRAVPTVSTKGYTGHTLAACGALEAIFAMLTLEHGLIPPSVGAEELDPDVHLSVPTTAVHRPVRNVLSNAFAFGGNNVSLILGAP